MRRGSGRARATDRDGRRSAARRCAVSSDDLSKAFFAYGQFWNEFMWPLVLVFARQRIGVARRGRMAKSPSCSAQAGTMKEGPALWRGALILISCPGFDNDEERPSCRPALGPDRLWFGSHAA